MRALLVVMHDVLSRDPFEVSRAHDQQTIEALRTQRPHHTFGVGIGIWRPIGRDQEGGILCTDHGVEAGRVLRITVADEESHVDLGVEEVHRDVSGLLGHPGIIRMCRDAGDPESAPSDLQEEENVQPPQEHGVHREEVGGHDVGRLSTEELRPAHPSPWCGSHVPVGEDLGDGAGGQPNTELSQFALDAAVTLKGVLPGQTPDERCRVLVDLGPTGAAVRIGPASGHQAAVPGEKRLRPHSECAPPGPGEESTQGRQRGTVRRFEVLALHLSSEHGNLVAQGEKLDLPGRVRLCKENDKLEKASHGNVNE